VDEEAARYWRREAACASGLLAGRVAVGHDAAAALFCKGWALGQTVWQAPGRGPDAAAVTEAREALSLASAFLDRAAAAEGPRAGGKSEGLRRKIQRELAALPAGDGHELGEELTVLDVAAAAESPGDPHAGRLVLLATSAGGRWSTLPCPAAFSWLRCGELAAAATPARQHLLALDALGLRHRVGAERLGAPREPVDHWEDVVAQVAKALAGGSGCLVYCGDGFGASGVALACFLVAHGLDEPVAAAASQPKMTAGEAVEVVRALRPGSLASLEHEAQVQQFAQVAWGRQISKVQQAFSGSSPAPERPQAPTSARVVKQPGDGNCLYHSLAYGLGAPTVAAAVLRGAIAGYMEEHPELLIAGTALGEWIQMLTGQNVTQYARKMAKGSQWGGAPEMAVCSKMKNVNIHVYERRGASFELTVPFDVGSSQTVRVLYVGGVHYDALVF